MRIRTILKWYPAGADTGRVKVVILCGGQGTRMREETEFRPKPMVDIGGKPILWHIMRRYAAYGLRDFVLCLGYRGEMIKEYFLRYHALGADFTVDLAAGAVECHRPAAEDDEIRQAVGGVGLHDVPQDRLAADLDHRLGPQGGFFAQTGAVSAGEYRDFHQLCPGTVD